MPAETLAEFTALQHGGVHPETARRAVGAKLADVADWLHRDPILLALCRENIAWWRRRWVDYRPARSDKWARAVVRRDGCCQRCASTKRLHAHHRLPWADHPERRFDLDNGEALCPTCHAAEHPAYAPLILGHHRG